MPLLAVERDREDTVLREIDRELPPRRIGLLWHSGRHRSAPTEAFVAIAQAVAAQLAADLSLVASREA